MSRNLTTDMASGIAAATVRPILLFEAVFGGTTVHYWTGLGPLSWNSVDWQGIGTLIESSPVKETDGVKAQGITLKVKGVSSADVATALGEVANGTDGSIRLALLTEAGAIVADPKVIFRGRLDIAEIDDSNPEEPVINLDYANALIDLERPREWRFTDEHQQTLYEGDTGLRFVAGLQDAELVWGRR